MVLGKFITAATLDALFISRMKMICSLFYEKDLAMALALSAIPTKLAIVANGLISPYVYDQTNSLTDTWAVGVLVLCGSFVCTLAFAFIDYRFEKHHLKIDVSITDLTIEQGQMPPAATRSLRLQDWKEMNSLIWIIGAMSGFSIAAFTSLFDNLNTMLQRKFGFSTQSSSDVSLVFLFPSLVMTILVSVIIDKKGKRSEILCFGAFCLVIAAIMFQVLPGCDGCYNCLIPLFFCGMFMGSYLVASYGCIPFLVKKEHMGMAFGSLQLLQNVISLGMPYAFGSILDANKVGSYQSYTAGLLFLCGVAVIGTIFGMLIVYFDYKQGKPLSQLKPNDVLSLRESANE